MLVIYRKFGDVIFSQLKELYWESIQTAAKESSSNEFDHGAYLDAEQDFYLYLKDVFFRISGAYCAVWQENGMLYSAARMEPYKDGYLLSALETHPNHRRQGYATKLMRSILEQMPDQKVYSHIHKKNFASARVHEDCGFRIHSDMAVFLDGSASSSSNTWIYP